MIQLLWRIPLAIIAAGLALYAFPTEGVWILAALIPGLIFLATRGLGFWVASAVGFIAGQAYYISHIEWLALYLGPVPLIALSTLMSFFFALGVGATAWLYRRLKPKGYGLVGFAFAAASIWTLREWVGSNFPYGGFPWSRLGMTQADGWFANYAWWGGISLIGFALVLISMLLVLISLEAIKKRPAKLVPMAAIAAAVALIPAITPIGLGTEQVGEIRIAAVQGNALAGLFSNQERGAILQNHLDASYVGIANEEDLDLIVWPENASDISPLDSAGARAEIDTLVEKYQAPLAFGTITYRGEEAFNSTIFWEPGIGPTDFYDKKRPVPFAEYVPDRAFWRSLAPDLIDLVPRGYSFGTRDGIFSNAEFTAGSLICFEIAEDDIPRGLVLEGAQLILSQTNNADFGYSDETYQQAAIARLRAIETGRAVVNISTVGLSAIYLPSGAVLDELEWYTADAMVQNVPLIEGSTPATGLGLWFDGLNAALALSFLALGIRRKR
jgi:apolipoprotein N-acyltransferase